MIERQRRARAAQHIDHRRSGVAQRLGRRRKRAAGGEDVVDEYDVPAAQYFGIFHGEAQTVLQPLGARHPRLLAAAWKFDQRVAAGDA